MVLRQFAQGGILPESHKNESRRELDKSNNYTVKADCYNPKNRKPEIVSTPQEINLALSGQIDTVMQKYFPDAKKRGSTYEMGDLDGNQGKSVSVFRARGGVYLAKEHQGGDCIPILSLSPDSTKTGRRRSWKPDASADCMTSNQ